MRAGRTMSWTEHDGRLLGHGVAVAYIDLDGMKGVNDEHGHAAGDQLLGEVAGRILRAIRPGDTAVRRVSSAP